ncbi:origin recognition complex subunit 2-like [Planoprotostelium fungivorum]|uniref:Origin recognition complex subunit 2 n=1 Tax=Planoprotostelium fungivorum TaxID=1890364 RepID=A0A2P6N6M5_9EUKA|nr:origin recognition complex subunit 2-like [Planoprotostelium fungivorum]
MRTLQMDEIYVSDEESEKNDYFNIQGDKEYNLNLSQSQQLREVIIQSQQSVINRRQQTLQHLNHQFEEWNIQLTMGNNVMVYGWGSKHQLLENFVDYCQENSDEHDWIVFNGYTPTADTRQILQIVLNQVLHISASGTPLEQLSRIRSAMANRERKLRLLVHSIDGRAIENWADQNRLSLLAAITNLTVIASIDHYQGMTGWDAEMLEGFRWVWYEASTFEHYLQETTDSDSVIHNTTTSDKDIHMNGLRYILRSLTQNGRKIFHILAQQQIESGEEGGLPYSLFYQKCKEKFLVANEASFRSHLTEFFDHRVFVVRNDKDVPSYIIPMSSGQLQHVLDTEFEHKE